MVPTGFLDFWVGGVGVMFLLKLMNARAYVFIVYEVNASIWLVLPQGFSLRTNFRLLLILDRSVRAPILKCDI